MTNLSRYIGYAVITLGVALCALACMPGGATLTARFILVWLGGLAIFEGWTLSNDTKNDTISHCVVDYCQSRPYVTLLILIFTILLAGHWFLNPAYWWLWRQPIFIK